MAPALYSPNWVETNLTEYDNFNAVSSTEAKNFSTYSWLHQHDQETTQNALVCSPRTSMTLGCRGLSWTSCSL